MKRELYTCDKCGKVFLMRSYLHNHKCEDDKTEEKPATRKELVQKAKEQGVKGADRMKREDLEEAVK